MHDPPPHPRNDRGPRATFIVSKYNRKAVIGLFFSKVTALWYLLVRGFPRCIHPSVADLLALTRLARGGGHLTGFEEVVISVRTLMSLLTE